MAPEPERGGGPNMTIDIAQQMRDEAEHGSMFLPDDPKKRSSRRLINNNQRSGNKNG